MKPTEGRELELTGEQRAANSRQHCEYKPFQPTLYLMPPDLDPEVKALIETDNGWLRLLSVV